MANEPENLTHILLRDIRAKQDEHTARFDQLEARMKHLEQQFENMHKVVTYSLGQSTEAQFRQSRSDQRIDTLFDQLEKLLASKQPV